MDGASWANASHPHCYDTDRAACQASMGQTRVGEWVRCKGDQRGQEGTEGTLGRGLCSAGWCMGDSGTMSQTGEPTRPCSRSLGSAVMPRGRPAADWAAMQG